LPVLLIAICETVRTAGVCEYGARIVDDAPVIDVMSDAAIV
jgi:hypothetical protein